MAGGRDSVRAAQAVGQGEQKYFKIPANLYQPDEIISRDLYLLYQNNFILFRPANLLWKREDSVRLAEFNVSELYILCNNKSEHHLFLENNLAKILDEPSIDRVQKTQAMYDTSQAIIEEIFLRPTSSENVRRSVSFVKNSVDFLKEKENFLELMKMASTSFSEYTHAIQVSAYSIALAREAGIKTYNELSAIGIGSILHDVGKTKINSAILQNPQSLSEEERREVERHPEYGYEILNRQRTVPEMAEMIVLQHHERPHGNGYPYQLGSDMVCSAKIVAICDCFDSLTSDRPWKKKMSPIEAIQYMRKELAAEYDQNLLTQFIKVIGSKG